MVKPGKLANSLQVLSLEHLTCGIERKPGKQNLVSLAEGAHAAGSINLYAKEVFTFFCCLRFGDENLTNVNPDAIEHPPAGFRRQLPQGSLHSERELYRVGGLSKDDEK